MMGFGFAVIGSVLYVRTDYGGTDSGSKNTSRANTIFRLCYDAYIMVLAAIKKSKSFSTANGDDCITHGIQKDKYLLMSEIMNLRTRDVGTNPDGFTFCSHDYCY
jgi:hypothetical protein